jgi:hypothetical protein
MASSANGLDAPKLTAKVKIGSTDYEIQWGPLTEYLLSSKNVVLQQVLDAQKKNEPRFFALAMELLSALTAHRYPAGEHPKAAEFAARIGPPPQFAEAWGTILAHLAASGAVTLTKNAPEPAKTPAVDPAPPPM